MNFNSPHSIVYLESDVQSMHVISS